MSEKRVQGENPRSIAIKRICQALDTFRNQGKDIDYSDYADVLETAGKIILSRCSVKVKIRLIRLS